MERHELETILDGLKDLPTLPASLVEVNRMLADTGATVDEVGEVIAYDPSLTARLLRVANSSFYGLSQQVDTVARAVTVLGFSTVRNLALTVAVQESFGGTVEGIDLRGLWHHSLGCGTASRELARVGGPKLQEKAYVCGILHDIGILAVARCFPEECKEILSRCHAGEMRPLRTVEKEVLGFSHPEIGALMVERWRFPAEYVSAIHCHHDCPDTQADEGRGDALLTHSVRAGNSVAKTLKLGASIDPESATVEPLIWENLGIRKEDLKDVLRRIEAEYREAVDSFGM